MNNKPSIKALDNLDTILALMQAIIPANQEMWDDLCKSVDLSRIDCSEVELIAEFNDLLKYNTSLRDIINHFNWLVSDSNDPQDSDDEAGLYEIVDFDRDDY